MSERGTYRIDRGIFDHPRFAPEPFTEREAWSWMIGQAAFRPHCRRVGSVRVTLARGEFAHSIRFLADVWQWSPSRVRRFLEGLATEIDGDGTLIGTRANGGITIVTIRNYDAYQEALPDCSTANGTANGTPPAQQRHKEESIAKSVVVGGGEAAPCASDDVGDEDFDIARAVLRAKGDDPESPALITVAYQAVVWRKRGYDRAEILAKIAEIAGKPERFSLSYYFAAIEGREQRKRAPPPNQTQLPLPSVPVSENPHAQTRAHHPATSWQQSRDRWRAASAKLNAHVSGAAEPEAESGDDGGGRVVKLASAAGRG